MNCNEVKKELSALIDGEVGNEEKEALLSHIAECESCKKEYDDLQELKKEFAKLDLQLKSALSESVMQKIISENIPKKKTPFLMRHIGVASAILLIISLALYSRLMPVTENMQKTDSNASMPMTNGISKEDVKYESISDASPEEPNAEFAKNEAVTEAESFLKDDCDGLKYVVTEDAEMPKQNQSDPVSCAPEAEECIQTEDIGTIYADCTSEFLVEIFDGYTVSSSDAFMSVNMTSTDAISVLTKNSVDIISCEISTESELTNIYHNEK